MSHRLLLHSTHDTPLVLFLITRMRVPNFITHTIRGTCYTQIILHDALHHQFLILPKSLSHRSHHDAIGFVNHKIMIKLLDHTRAISHKSFDRLRQILIEYFYSIFFYDDVINSDPHMCYTLIKNRALLKLVFMIQIFPHVLPRCRSTRQTHRLIQDFKN